VISLDCPYNIMGSSAANGNHMLAGLTLHHNHYTREEETKTRGEETKVEARSKRGEQNREVRGAQRGGGGTRGVEVER